MRLGKEIFAIATKNLEEAVKSSNKSKPSFNDWYKRIQKLSNYCNERNGNGTYIAMIGTAILAKTFNPDLNPFALKEKTKNKNKKVTLIKGGYSARGLCQHVLAAHSPRLGIDIGAKGREPLNNQPFFAEDTVHKNYSVKRVDIFNYLYQCLEELDKVKDAESAKKILTCFVHIRKKEELDYALKLKLSDSKIRLLEFIKLFVNSDSEYGKRAQAVVSGMMDLAFHDVQVTKVHDPDRHFPGDIVVRNEDKEILLSVEVRDKKVMVQDLYAFIQKLIDNRVSEGAILAISKDQETIDFKTVERWGEERGIKIYFFTSWRAFVDSSFFWVRKFNISNLAIKNIFERSKQLEVSQEGMEFFSNRK